MLVSGLWCLVVMHVCVYVRFHRKTRLTTIEQRVHTHTRSSSREEAKKKRMFLSLNCDRGIRQINANQKQRMWNNGNEKAQADVDMRKSQTRDTRQNTKFIHFFFAHSSMYANSFVCQNWCPRTFSLLHTKQFFFLLSCSFDVYDDKLFFSVELHEPGHCRHLLVFFTHTLYLYDFELCFPFKKFYACVGCVSLNFVRVEGHEQFYYEICMRQTTWW